MKKNFLFSLFFCFAFCCGCNKQESLDLPDTISLQVTELRLGGNVLSNIKVTKYKAEITVTHQIYEINDPFASGSLHVATEKTEKTLVVPITPDNYFQAKEFIKTDHFPFYGTGKIAKDKFTVFFTKLQGIEFQEMDDYYDNTIINFFNIYFQKVPPGFRGSKDGNVENLFNIYIKNAASLCGNSNESEVGAIRYSLWYGADPHLSYTKIIQSEFLPWPYVIMDMNGKSVDLSTVYKGRLRNLYRLLSELQILAKGIRAESSYQQIAQIESYDKILDSLPEGPLKEKAVNGRRYVQKQVNKLHASSPPPAD